MQQRFRFVFEQMNFRHVHVICIHFKILHKVTYFGRDLSRYKTNRQAV